MFNYYDLSFVILAKFTKEKYMQTLGVLWYDAKLGFCIDVETE